MMKTLEFNLRTVLVEMIAQCVELKGYKILINLNRAISKTHVNEIKESFKKFGTGSSAITVIETFCFGVRELYVADGQHRLRAAIELDLPLNVTIVRLENDTKLNLMKFISALNNTSKGWGNTQYMESFANCDVKAYKTLQRIAKESKLKTTDLRFIFLENDGKLVKEYKQGSLTKLPNEALNMKMYHAVMKVVKLIPNKAYTRRALYKSMRNADNFDKFANAIVKASKLLKSGQGAFSENEAEFYQHMERIRTKLK